MSLILVFHNDGTGGETDANYDVSVLVGDGTKKGSTEIARGRVEGHDRSCGWRALVDWFLHHK